MGRKAGVISIDIDMGTAKFLANIDQQNAKLATLGKTAEEAGHKTVSSMQASSAAIRLLENPSGNNVRAIERLISIAPGAAQLMQNIFVPVAAFSAGGMLVRLGEDAYNFVKKISDAPQRIASAFYAIDAPLKMTNDELALSNIRLENVTAKLEGKPENHLAEALAEARVQADKLADSLDQDLKKLVKLLDDETHGATTAMFYGQIKTSDIKDDMEKFQRQVEWANGDPSKLQDLYKNKIAEYQTRVANRSAIVGTPTLAGFLSEERYGELKKTLEYLQDQQSRITLTQTAQKDETAHTKAQGDHEARTKSDEARKKAQEVTLELTRQLADARGAQQGALERIDALEADEINRLAQTHQQTQANLELVYQIYDSKRLTEYGKLADDLGHMQLDWAQKARDATKDTFDTQFKSDIEQAVRNFEQGAKAAEEWAKATNKITAESRSEDLRHRVAMAGAYGNPNDPLGTLTTQQAIEKAQIEDSYQEKLKLAVNDLDRQLALNERNLELLKLQNQLEEKNAELRHKNLNDFFTEMQHGAKNAGDILYDGMHSALDRVSADFAQLLTHPEKTNARQLFGGTIKDIGQSISEEAIHSGLQRGLAALANSSLGKRLGIHIGAGKPDGSTQALALWVQWANNTPLGPNPLTGMIPALPSPFGWPSVGIPADPGMSWPELSSGSGGNDAYRIPGGLINRTGSPIDGVPSVGTGGLSGLLDIVSSFLQNLSGGVAGAAGGLGGLMGGLGGLFSAAGDATSGGVEAVSSTISFGGMMANGGAVYPGYIYGVNDGKGREFFSPGTTGTIIPGDKMPGGGAVHHHTYRIDARGAQLGVENRVARAIEHAHNAAVSNSVRASAERAHRTPKRSS